MHKGISLEYYESNYILIQLLINDYYKLNMEVVDKEYIRPEDPDQHFLVNSQDHNNNTTAFISSPSTSNTTNLSIIHIIIISLVLSATTIILLLIIANIFIFHCPTTQSINSTKYQDYSILNGSTLPKIFWIYTENQVQAQQMEMQVYISHLNQTARSSGFEVRFANSWNSYDWLSDNLSAIITSAMQKNQIDEGVHTLLKLGLLIENGGIILNIPDAVLLRDNLQWIEEAFNSQSPFYSCARNTIQVYIPSSERSQGQSQIIDMVAALPQSSLLKDAFKQCTNLFTTGQFEVDSILKVMRWNQDTNVAYIINSFQSCINAALIKLSMKNISSCEKYGLQIDKNPTTINMKYFRNAVHLKVLLKNHTSLTSRYNIHILTGMKNKAITYFLGSLLKGFKNPSMVSNTSLLFRILSTPQSKPLFLQQLPLRNIEICLILMEQVSVRQMLEVYEEVKRQTYQNWKLVFFASEQEVKGAINDRRVRVISSSKNKIRNIQIAVCKICDPKGYALLLNGADRWTSDKDLASLAEALQPRDILGAFLHLNHSGQLIKAKPSFANFKRARDGIVNPNLSLMKSILNHLRLFSVESFRFLPQFDLRDIYGNYFTDRIIFLMSFLQIIYDEIIDERIFYLIKKYADVWNVPRRTITVDVTLKVEQLEEIDTQQLFKTRAKLGCETLNEALSIFIERKIPFTKIVALNNGDHFQSVEQKTGPDLIPKIIHQAWLGTKQLPLAKKYFYNKTQKMYPSYQVKLWRDSDLTRQNFPLSYDVIQTLLKFNSKSPYSKLATVTDILRHELLQREGGFWKDAGMNLLRPIFDKFLKYKLVIPVDKTVRYRWLQGMCFFGNIPKLSNMGRITNYRNLNRMRLYDSYAINIAGPIDFRQLLVGQQEYDPSFLVMPYDTFYPGQIAEHPEKDLCTKQKGDLTQDDTIVFVENGWYLLQNCADLYPYSYAIEHNRYGDSWSKRK